MSNLSDPLYNPINKIAHEIRGLLQILVARLSVVQHTTKEKHTEEDIANLLNIITEFNNTLNVLLGEAIPMKTPPLRCVVAEDNPDTMTYLTNALRKAGHEVVGTATTANQLYNQVTSLGPELIIYDISLAPNGEGEDHSNALDAIAQLIVEQPGLIHVAITGSHEITFIERAADNGVFSYLVKPVFETQLIAAVNVAYGRWVKFQEIRQEATDKTEQLQDVQSVMKAKHILMKQWAWSEDRAYKWIQRTAKQKRVRMTAIALEIINGAAAPQSDGSP